MELLLIGAGCAGCAVTRLFASSGMMPRALITATERSAKRVSELFPRTSVCSVQEVDIAALCEEPALLLFATKDDQLSATITEWCAVRDTWQGFSAIHLSGGASLSLLDCFKERGARVGALHPCYPIPNRESEFPDDGTVCVSFEGDSELAESFRGILERANIQFATLSGISREAYHAAMVLSAGHVMTLLARAEEVFSAEGLSKEDARKMLSSVAQGVVANFREAPEEVSAASLLTGPFVRGDEVLIDSHANALKKSVRGLDELYIRVGEETKKIRFS